MPKLTRFTSLDNKGKPLPAGSTKAVAVRENTHKNGDPRKKPLVWDRKSLGPFTLADQDAALATHKVCGKKAVAPGIIDLFELAPRNDAEEAEFKKYFGEDYERSWHRSATPYTPGSGCRRGVHFGRGDSGYLGGDFVYFVRAVRASQ